MAARIVLIDGENLLYGLRTLLGSGKVKASREHFIDFNFRGLLSDVLGEDEVGEIFFYGAKLRRYAQTPELQSKTEAVVKQQARLVNTLQSQKIHFVKVGYLRARETEACTNCEHTEWHLLEKGVDVGLAVKMVTDVPRGKEIVLVSSDTDLMPAVKAVLLRGAKLTYVGFENRVVSSLSSVANSTRVITKEMVKKHLKS